MRDIRFHSASLGRDVAYRVISPRNIPAGKNLPVVYLLHGGDGTFRDWSNYSDVARFAEQGFLLIMPDGGYSYYVNVAARPQDRYEDFITRDLIADVESRFPAATRRSQRAIVGVSMGGYGAVNLSMKHPDLFLFAGGLSSALDVPSRPFSLKRIGQYHAHEAIFGAWGSAARRANDPYWQVLSAHPKDVPYFYLTCGDQEGLLPANRKFAHLLGEQHLAFEFHAGPGGHDWKQWNSRLPALFKVLVERLNFPVGP
jgi:S-formylglutathione hydrolase FrmB